MNKKNINLWNNFVSEWGSINVQEKCLYCLYTFLLIPNVLSIFRAIENRIGLSFFLEISNGFFITLAVLGSLVAFRNKLKIWDFVFVLALGIYHQLVPVLNPDVAMFATEGSELFLLSCLPLYLVGRTVDDSKSTTIFLGMSYIALALQILFICVLGVEENEYGEVELMTKAYSFLPFVLFLIWDAIKRRTIVGIIAAVAAMFLIFSMGTRGPVVCVIFFICFYFIFFQNVKIIYKILFAVAAFVFYKFSFEISAVFSAISASLGLSTRVFDHILESSLINYQESNGRDEIWSNVWYYMTSHDKWFGNGFYTDRLASFQGGYAHNFELELLCDFGLIGGSIILCVIFLFVYRAFKNNIDSDSSIFVLVFFCSSLMYLQFSSSFLEARIFWFFLGLCISMNHRKRLEYSDSEQNL